MFFCQERRYFIYPQTGGRSDQHDPRALPRLATPSVFPSSTALPQIAMSFSRCDISCCEGPCVSSSLPGLSRPSVVMAMLGSTRTRSTSRSVSPSPETPSDRRVARVPAQGTLPTRRAAVSLRLLQVARSLPSLHLCLGLAPAGLPRSRRGLGLFLDSRPPPWRALPQPGFALRLPRRPLKGSLVIVLVPCPTTAMFPIRLWRAMENISTIRRRSFAKSKFHYMGKVSAPI